MMQVIYIYVAVIVGCCIWFFFEARNAPLCDRDGNQLEEGDE